MNTPAHVIFGLAAFAKPGRKLETGAIVAGSLLPDLSLYLMTSWSIWIQGISPQIVFDELYFSDNWQAVFAVDNSFLVWGAIAAIGLGLGQRWLWLLAAAALLHLLFDIALHNDDARQHFWPVSDWVFNSPISYWDCDHFAGIVGPLEIGVSLVLCVCLLRRFRNPYFRIGIVALAVMETAPGLVWLTLF